MAVTKCPECNSDISDLVPSCPKCGYPIKQPADSIPNSDSKPELIPTVNKPGKKKLLLWLLIIPAIISIWLIASDMLFRYTHGRLTTRDIGQLRRNRGIPDRGTPIGRWEYKSTQLLSSSLLIQAKRYGYKEFSTKPNWKIIKVSGSITVSGGKGNDIRILVMTKHDYDNLINKHPYNRLYDSGQITKAKIAANLPSIAEDYVLVYDNSFSVHSNKKVDGAIFLTYSYWDIN